MESRALSCLHARGLLLCLAILSGLSSALAAPPVITQQPVGVRIFANQPSALSVGATSDTQDPRISYRWERNGLLLPVSTPTLSLVGSEHASGIYRARIRNIDGLTWSDPARVDVLYPGSAVQWGAGHVAAPLLTNAVEAAAGGGHVIARLDDGTVLGWGDNRRGQATPPPGLGAVQQVAAGAHHSLALDNGGKVVAWGGNDQGQGNPPSQLERVAAVAAGGSHSLALLQDGTVVAWGSNTRGELDIPPGLPKVAAIAAGQHHNLALTTEGQVVAWGDNTSGQSSVPAHLTGIRSIAAGGRHSLALREDGRVVGWGDDGRGQATPPPGLDRVVLVAAGDKHSLALRSDGTVVAWGDNSAAQTGLPSFSLDHGIAVAAGGDQSIALNHSSALEYPVDPARDLLLLYNETSPESVALKDYYQARRPGVARAAAIGLRTTRDERILVEDYERQIRDPVLEWLRAHPTLRPLAVVLFLDLPTRCTDRQGLFQPGVSEALRRDLGSGVRPMVHYLNMGSPADCRAYIDKLKRFGDRFSPGQLIIRPGRQGHPNARFLVDGIGYAGAENVGRSVTNALALAGVATAQIDYVERGRSNLASGADVAGYFSWGLHGGLGEAYASDGKVRFSGDSSWHLVQTAESFNGRRSYQGHGNFVRWFSRGAFGGSNYANTPVAAVAHVDEPSLTGIHSPDLWRLWAGGKIFGVAAWESARSGFALAVGDPFVAR